LQQKRGFISIFHNPLVKNVMCKHIQLHCRTIYGFPSSIPPVRPLRIFTMSRGPLHELLRLADGAAQHEGEDDANQLKVVNNVINNFILLQTNKLHLSKGHYFIQKFSTAIDFLETHTIVKKSVIKTMSRLRVCMVNFRFIELGRKLLVWLSMHDAIIWFSHKLRCLLI